MIKLFTFLMCFNVFCADLLVKPFKYGAYLVDSYTMISDLSLDVRKFSEKYCKNNEEVLIEKINNKKKFERGDIVYFPSVILKDDVIQNLVFFHRSAGIKFKYLR